MKNVYTNTYGLARAIIAFGSLTTFAFTDIHYYYEKEVLANIDASASLFPNLFFIAGYEHLVAAKIVSILVLIWVISGYLPQISGILHAWISYSFFGSSLLVEGGDQLSQIITILLIPVTLSDKRLNHWSSSEYFNYGRSKFIEYFSYSCLLIIRLQISVLYFFAFVEKFKVPEWLDGSAFYYWYNNNPFGASEHVHLLLDPFVQNKISITMITWSVLLTEIILFGAIFMERRKQLYVFILGIFFHFLVVIVHGLPAFFFAMAGALVLYLLPLDKFIDFKAIVGVRTRKANQISSKMEEVKN